MSKDTIVMTGESRIHTESTVMATGKAVGYNDKHDYYFTDYLGSLRVMLNEQGNADSWSDFYLTSLEKSVKNEMKG